MIETWIMAAAVLVNSEHIPMRAALDVTAGTVKIGTVSASRIESSPAALTLLINSGSPWQLAVMGGVRSYELGAHEPGAALEVLGESAEWRPVTATPTLLASGAGAGDPLPITIPLRARATFDVPPGEHRNSVRFVLNPSGMVRDVEIEYVIAPTVTVDRLSVQEGGNVDVTSPRVYTVQRQSFAVHANTDWTLSVTLQREIQQRGTGRASRNALYVCRTGDEEHYTALTGGRPIAIATGGPTGERASVVNIDVGVSTADLILSGIYDGEIEVVATPRGPVVQSKPKGSEPK